MRNIFFQGISIVFIFLLTLFLMSRIDWMKIFKVKEASDKTEEKLGDLFWEYFKRSDQEVTDNIIYYSVDSILVKICEANNIDRSLIKLHVLRSSEINAFAMPDNHMVVYTGLIDNCDTPEELAGVIGHELAHINERHVMKKLVKEIGLSVLISISTGNAGGEIVREIARTMSSSAYDRTLEKEADLMSIKYLNKAKINPEGLANFLYKISDADVPSFLTWLSTHPDSKERAAYIIDQLHDSDVKYKPALTSETWEKIQAKLDTWNEYDEY